MADGQVTVNVIVDSNKLKPSGAATGTLTLKDTALGRTLPIAVSVTVGRLFEFVVGEAWDFLGAPGHAGAFGHKPSDDHAVFNVTPGQARTREFTLAKRTGPPFAWRIESPIPWMSIEPASGTLAPAERTFVKVTARPPDPAAATHETLLVVSEKDGLVAEKARFL